MRVSISKSREYLSILWFIWAFILFLLFLLMSVFGPYKYHLVKAWGWFLPTVMPVLSLMVGVLVASAAGESKTHKTTTRFFFLVALGLSATYLASVSIVILSQALYKFDIDVMNSHSVWLGPLQGLVSATLGVFFFMEHSSK